MTKKQYSHWSTVYRCKYCDQRIIYGWVDLPEGNIPQIDNFPQIITHNCREDIVGKCELIGFELDFDFETDEEEESGDKVP